MKTFESKNISITIDRPWNSSYRYISDPRNLTQWASGLGHSINKIDGDWVADSPMGRIKIKFAEENKFGVLDHDVTLESGESFYNPMRVFENNEGCEVVFTLFRRPDVTDENYENDALTIKKDLTKLKQILENL